MAWWNDILGLLREEVRSLRGEATSADPPTTLGQARDVLQRTTRELGDARGRAEAGRRRLRRAQAELEALTQQPESRPHYQARLLELARVISHESELLASFDSHIQRLDEIQARIQSQLDRLQRDLDMAAAAQTLKRTTEQVAPAANVAAPADHPPGFRRQREAEWMAQLRELPGDRKVHRPGDPPAGPPLDPTPARPTDPHED